MTLKSRLATLEKENAPDKPGLAERMRAAAEKAKELPRRKITAEDWRQSAREYRGQLKSKKLSPKDRRLLERMVRADERMARNADQSDGE